MEGWPIAPKTASAVDSRRDMDVAGTMGPKRFSAPSPPLGRLERSPPVRIPFGRRLNHVKSALAGAYRRRSVTCVTC